jgi:hypothetical protein
MTAKTCEAKTREEKLLDSIKALADETVRRELDSLKRKFKKLEESRNEWREAANRYQRQLLEKNNSSRF